MRTPFIARTVEGNDGNAQSCGAIQQGVAGDIEVGGRVSSTRQGDDQRNIFGGRGSCEQALFAGDGHAFALPIP